MATVSSTARTLVGRDQEAAVLAQVLAPAGPLVVFVHGPAGVGKSAVLRGLRATAAEAGAAVVALDCRAFEPTAPGFLAALGEAVHRPADTVASAARALAELGERVLLVVDTYELFRGSDPWLRSVLAPALAQHVRIVLGGREPPIGGWLDARGDPVTFRALALGPLEPDAALEVLTRAGVRDDEARTVNRVARGHPLALQVAAAALREQPRFPVDQVAVPRVVDELIRLYLENVDAETRRLLDAAAVVRRVTGPLLRAMLPDAAVPAALEQLAALPFVDDAADGLRLHESVQAAVAERFRARDPDTYRRYRAAAWRSLRRDVDAATRSELWRYTADMLYLLENPVVREAFFPTTAHVYAVDDATPLDSEAIRDIVVRHEPEPAAAVLLAWWDTCPQFFRAVRDGAGTVVGVSIVAPAEEVPARLTRVDPVVATWRRHLAEHPLPRGQRALFDRCELSSEHGDAPGPVQAAIWLDIKRVYMEMRPHLGRLYAVSPDAAPLADALTTLGFRISTEQVPLGRSYTPLWLDFGPESVDGWLARLAAAELGVEPESLLDRTNRELVLDEGRVPLTPLEFGVVEQLLRRRGDAVTRATLLDQVWGQRDDVGSNVVDVVVRSLRQKMGPTATALETVRGVGYRLRV